MPANQNPEQAARDNVDRLLTDAGWVVQDKKAIDFSAGPGIAVREYQTDIGPADYVLFVDKIAVGVTEAKKEEIGQNLTTAEDQTAGYGNAKLKWIKNQKPLPFLYESTGPITRFTDIRDPKPRSSYFRLSERRRRVMFEFHERPGHGVTTQRKSPECDYCGFGGTFGRKHVGNRSRSAWRVSNRASRYPLR